MDWSPYAVGGAAARSDSFTGLKPDFASGVYRMVQDAHAAGIPLQITSAYRSPEKQAELYERALKKYGSPQAARKWVAPPGRSQHNFGTAVDFAVNGSLLRDADSPAAKWVKANAANYGLDVPMAWEPWQVEMAGARGQKKPQAVTGGGGQDTLLGGLSISPKTDTLEAPMQAPQKATGLLGSLFPEMTADKQDRVALALSGLSMHPNQAVMQGAQQRIGDRRVDAKEAKAEQKVQAQANKTIQWLKTQAGTNPNAAQALTMLGEGVINAQQAVQLAMEKPAAVKGTEINGQLVNPITGEVMGDFRDTDAGGYRQVTGEAAEAMGLDPTKVYNIGPDGKVSGIGGASTVIENNIGAGETAFSKETGKLMAQEAATVVEQGALAQRNIGVVERLGGLLDATPEGAGGAFVAAAANMGIKLDGSSEVEAAQALISQLVPQQRPPGSGPMSDADLNLFKQSLPRLINSREGNKKIVETMVKIAQYDVERGVIARQLQLGEITPQQAAQAYQSLGNPLEGFSAGTAETKPKTRLRFDPETGEIK